MKISSSIDLGRSLRQVYGDNPGRAVQVEQQVEQDRARQTATTEAILKRFVSTNERERRELVLLADEVGLGKTYVALAVAVSLLDAIRRGEAPEGMPANKPVVLVLTPNNDALYNKWLREAETFRRDCARTEDALDWLQIRRPLEQSTKSGNAIDLTFAIREASRSRPLLLIAKQGVLGAALHERDFWRRRALAVVFDTFRVKPEDRRWWCRQILGSGSQQSVPELLDLRKSRTLWQETDHISVNLERAYRRAIEVPWLQEKIAQAIQEWNGPRLDDLTDDLTRLAHSNDWPLFPLVIIDEVHGLKNKTTQARQHLQRFLDGRAARLLGLSATPFQLRHEELLSVLNLRTVTALSPDRVSKFDATVDELRESITTAGTAGEQFRRRWLTLRPRDRDFVHQAWGTIESLTPNDRANFIASLRPQRVAAALEAALALATCNDRLQRHLRPFVIRHRHVRGYREHFVGKQAGVGITNGSLHFASMPGLEVRGDGELAHYLMMRAVTLIEAERGLPGLGAELTGSYRHLVKTSAVWRKMAEAQQNPLLARYRDVLETLIAPDGKTADHEHRKIQATVRRAMHFFERGQKTLIFCVFTKTAEALREELDAAVKRHLGQTRDRVFVDVTAFKNFRKRASRRHEPLFSLIQDQPLLGRVAFGEIGIPAKLRLGEQDLRRVAELIAERAEVVDDDKPDRRLILAAVEHVAVKLWSAPNMECKWLDDVFKHCSDLKAKMLETAWLRGRDPLSRSARAANRHTQRDVDAHEDDDADPLLLEEDDPSNTLPASPESSGQIDKQTDLWLDRLRNGAAGEVLSPYFREGVIKRCSAHLPLLAQHHGDLLGQLDSDTRVVAGQVFRRILMAEEFLLRYLTDAGEHTDRWADYLATRYTQQLEGHLESLKDRVTAYLETLVRARQNKSLLEGYYEAAKNQNVVQLVQGSTQHRDHFYLGFNTPYRPEILVSTSVGQEGIDLHRECRHVIHHDLCWNPATIEQRTGRVDRIGSKVERERVNSNGELHDSKEPTLEIAVPYLAATYDERMFEELYRRAQLFEVTMGGDLRVEDRFDPAEADARQQARQQSGIDNENENLGEVGDTGAVDLPESLIERLRIHLSVWNES